MVRCDDFPETDAHRTGTWPPASRRRQDRHSPQKSCGKIAHFPFHDLESAKKRARNPAKTFKNFDKVPRPFQREILPKSPHFAISEYQQSHLQKLQYWRVGTLFAAKSDFLRAKNK